MKRKGYVKAEFYRFFGSKYLYCGKLGVWAAFVFGVYIDERRMDVTALEAIDNGFYGMTGLLCLMICALPYAGSICEDMENRYFMAECLRGDVRDFARARAGMIFLSAMFVMIVGTVCYAVYIKMRYAGWWNESSTSYLLLAEMGTWYTGMLKRVPVLYFCTAGCLYGLLAGLLALLAALFSLFISNKLLTASIPFLFMYLLLDLSMISDLGEGKLNVWNIFQPFINLMGKDVYNFLYALLFSAAVGYLLYRMILWRMKWRLTHE